MEELPKTSDAAALRKEGEKSPLLFTVFEQGVSPFNTTRAMNPMVVACVNTCPLPIGRISDTMRTLRTATSAAGAKGFPPAVSKEIESPTEKLPETKPGPVKLDCDKCQKD